MASFSIGKLFELSGIRKAKPAEATAVSVNLAQATSISPEEQKTLLSRTFLPSLEPPADPGNILAYLDPIHTDLATRKYDSGQMRKLAPEIDQAASIMIPSIMAPNDLQSNTLSFNTTCPSLSADTISQINQLLTDYFSTTMKLDTRLAEWLRDIIYGSGSKPVMILPELYLSSLIEKELIPATEGIEGLESYLLKDRIYSGTNKEVRFEECRTTNLEQLDLYDDLRYGMEDLTKLSKNEPLANPTSFTTFVTHAEDAIVKQFGSITDLLTIHENPSVVGLASLKKVYSEKKIKAKLANRFKEFTQVTHKIEDIITLDDVAYKSEDELGHPLMMELPAEAVIPVYTPGTPNDHIGYFILLDKLGNPISTETDPHMEKASALNSSFNAMFTNKGLLNLDLNGQMDANKMAVSKVYENMLDKYIMKSLNNMEIENIEIGRNENVYKCMFRRLLASKQTKMIFVPSELLTYYRFQTNADGTGRSKLEDIKFVLSLRITLMVSKIMSAMDEAIVRQKLSVTFDEKTANPLATMKLLKSKFIENKIVNFTYNPTQIVKSIADRGLTIMPSNIPGLAEFALDSEPNPKSNSRPDDTLMEELKSMFILGLEVPPSALNSLGEDEYSRSIATTNLFFSKKIRDYQSVTCMYTSNLAKTYVQYSKPLKDSILEIISSSTGAAAAAGNDKIVAASALTEVIESITATLPSPNIAPDKAQYEEFKEYDAVMESILETLYNPALLEKDKDAADEVAMIRAYLKTKLMRDYLVNSGFGSTLDIPELSTVDTTSIIRTQQAILNFRKRIEENAKMLAPEGDGEDEDNGYN